jgi:hypothetical protein
LKLGNIVLIAAGAGVVQYRFRARVDKLASSETCGVRAGTEGDI